ncbi:M48 family metallopeptidase [Candidatus Woesearchaeota archaeon]|nr:M48 family metallopeptidase [Candidatus Woesearchaeota archaeon]
MYSQIESNKRNSIFLFVLFLIFIGVIVYIVNLLFFQGYMFIIVAAIIAIIFSLISYYSGDKIVLSMTKAKEANKKDHAYLINAVEGLAIAAGIPKPNVYVIPGQQINAFATGRNPKTSSVAVTEGCLQKLNRQELEGVLAHEMSHIKNYDIRVMMLASVLVGIIIFLTEIMLRSFLWGGLKGNDRQQGGGLQLVLIIIGVVLLILAPIIAQMIKFAISRKREYLADASGAMLTRYPKGLADALKKIKSDSSELRTASNATAHLFIANPFKKKQWLAGLFQTHPDVDLRIKKLESM